MLIAFCYEMGFSSVVFVGHDDGGLLALKAAQRLITTNDPIKVSRLFNQMYSFQAYLFYFLILVGADIF